MLSAAGLVVAELCRSVVSEPAGSAVDSSVMGVTAKFIRTKLPGAMRTKRD